MAEVSRILIAAPKSGSGKTLVTCGIMKALSDRKYNVRGVKCGPDFIDPMFHEKALGIRSRNLDGFLMSRSQMKKTLVRHGSDADITVMEGVMGYYDGIGGVTASCSAYETASLTRTPVLLVVDAGGCGLSVVPIIRGMAEYRKDAGISGIILNNMAESLVNSLPEVILKETGIPVVGSLPKDPAFVINSRHLGLLMPGEVKDLTDRLAYLADCVNKRFDLERIMEIARSAPSIEEPANNISRERNKYPVKIAVARDEAFCFMYDDNLELLADMGAEIEFFSPIRDEALPEGTQGIILPGGYPELYADPLSQNAAMRSAIQRAAKDGTPIMAECGGFLYLHRELRDQDGRAYPMAGALDASAWYAGKTGRFGYIAVSEPEKTGEGHLSIKAHEFHAYESGDPGQDYTAVKPQGNRTWTCIHKRNGGLWGFPHLYYPSAPDVAAAFLKASADCLQTSTHSG